METIENKVFTALKSVVTSAYTGAKVSGTYTRTPGKFPYVYIDEIDNYAQVIDCSNNEKLTAVTYEVNVFTDGETQKEMCKKIIKLIDTELTKMGFRRTMCSKTPNEDETIYRMTSRYSASVSNGTIYRR